MPRLSSHPSLVIASVALLAFALLASGVWLPKLAPGGRTEMGRTASITFADGTVLTLDEPETDREIHKRRRMAGFHPHEYRQIFILADGREMDVQDPWLGNRPPDAGLDEADWHRPLDLLTDAEASRRPISDASDLSANALCLNAVPDPGAAFSLVPPSGTATVSDAAPGLPWPSNETEGPLTSNLALSGPQTLVPVTMPTSDAQAREFHAPSAATAVPEPTTLPLVALAGLLTWLTVARRRSQGSYVVKPGHRSAR